LAPVPGAFSKVQLIVGGTPHTLSSCRKPTHWPLGPR